MFKATCASCGDTAEVPFRPTGEKPVYCRNCFKKDDSGFRDRAPRREGGFDRGSRDSGFPEKRMFDATCSDCGGNAQVPFRPTGEKPVYCRNCFSKHMPEGRSMRREPEVRTLQPDYGEQFRSMNAKLDTLISLLGGSKAKEAAPKAKETAPKLELADLTAAAPVEKAPKAAKKKAASKKKK